MKKEITVTFVYDDEGDETTIEVDSKLNDLETAGMVTLLKTILKEKY